MKSAAVTSISIVSSLRSREHFVNTHSTARGPERSEVTVPKFTHGTSSGDKVDQKASELVLVHMHRDELLTAFIVLSEFIKAPGFSLTRY